MKVGVLCIKKEGVHFDTPPFLFILFHASLLMFVINYVSKTRDSVKNYIFVNIYLAFSE